MKSAGFAMPTFLRVTMVLKAAFLKKRAKRATYQNTYLLLCINERLFFEQRRVSKSKQNTTLARFARFVASIVLQVLKFYFGRIESDEKTKEKYKE